MSNEPLKFSGRFGFNLRVFGNSDGSGDRGGFFKAGVVSKIHKHIVWSQIYENFGVGKIAPNNLLLRDNLFKTNYQVWFRQPYPNLT